MKEYKRLLSKNSHKPLEIDYLRKQLAELFCSRRKFLLNQPDDPIDTFFIIINAIHSYYLKEPLNEYTDKVCHNKCISHNYLWLDLCKIDVFYFVIIFYLEMRLRSHEEKSILISQLYI